MDWFHIVMAAFQTLCTIAPNVLPLFHGGAAKTADKIGSALTVVQAFMDGTAHVLDQSTLHPDLIAHAQTIASGGTTTTQPTAP